MNKRESLPAFGDPRRTSSHTGSAIALSAAAFLSGAAALVSQLVWIRRLGVLFGHTAIAVTIVVSIFMAGLGLGGWLFGRAADRRASPLRIYCMLELVLGAYAVAFPQLSDVMESAYVGLAFADEISGHDLLIKSLLAAALLLVPAALMGGTIPVLVRHSLLGVGSLDSRITSLYGLNTLGAACGAFVAAWALLPGLGLSRSSVLAGGFNVLAAAFVLAEARGRGVARIPSSRPLATRTPVECASPRSSGAATLLFLAGLSGVMTIGLEILWTRALAPRLASTVYSFATILVVLLLSLALAGFLVSVLERLGMARRSVAELALVLAGLAILVSIAVLGRIPGSSFGSAETSVALEVAAKREFLVCVLVMGLPLLLLGIVFPMSLRLHPREVSSSGEAFGQLYVVNAIGSVCSPLLIGFVLLPMLGLKACLTSLGVLCIAVGIGLLVVSAGVQRWRRIAQMTPVVVFTAGFLAWTPTDVRIWQGTAGEQLLEYREGLTNSIAVVRDTTGDVILKLDNEYRLGSVRTIFAQHRQALIPLLLHPSPGKVLMIGLGTGSSVGAAVRYGPAEIDVVEIVPELRDVLKYFRESNEDLASYLAEGRGVRLLNADGRDYVRTTRSRYDIVVGDLYIPWRAGEGAMYTREYLEYVRGVLAPGGMFCQWLPLYQFGTEELRTVVATFCGVFPAVHGVWLYFNADQAVLGLVGGNEEWLPDLLGRIEARSSDISRHDLLEAAGLARVEPLLGSVFADREALDAWSRGAAIETIDRPVVEFRAPRYMLRSNTERSVRNVKEMLSIAELVRQRDPASSPSWFAEEHVRRYREAITLFFAASVQVKSASRSGMAMESLERALELTPEWDWIAWNIERVLIEAIRVGDLDSAEKGSNLLQSRPAYRVAGLYHAATIAMNRGQVENARKFAREALALDPSHPPSRRLLQQLE